MGAGPDIYATGRVIVGLNLLRLQPRVLKRAAFDGMDKGELAQSSMTAPSALWFKVKSRGVFSSLGSVALRPDASGSAMMAATEGCIFARPRSTRAVRLSACHWEQSGLTKTMSARPETEPKLVLIFTKHGFIVASPENSGGYFSIL